MTRYHYFCSGGRHLLLMTLTLKRLNDENLAVGISPGKHKGESFAAVLPNKLVPRV